MAAYRCSFALLMLVVIVLPLISIVEGCFWTDCPIGGKRSAEVKECMSCGPEGKGRCAGPNICCQEGGCVIGDMAKECKQESLSTSVCEVKGVPCGADGQGRCVANGVCCDSSACSANSQCVQPRTTNRRELLSLLKRLISKVN